MSQDIFNEANLHFMEEGRRYEYGRGDKNLRNHSPNGRSDSSRTEQDLDGDGLRGVDCSSLVWRGLKNAGYDVGDAPFATSKLFNGGQVSDYSKQQFDVIDAKKASQINGELQRGDVLMFKSGHGQHVGIFKGYDKSGNIEFLGSQVSTGPAVVSKGTQKGGYWNGRDFEIVGALRAKPEFRVQPPLHGSAANVTPPSSAHEQIHVQASPRGDQLTDPNHPGNPLFKQAQTGMQAIDAKYGR
ncbi:NlpC/P60 family protein, partial [Variovorax sp. DXTD-1]|uniref:NlpC/P60 family protein n=1 Tax=Variovorax sp. DXTD-1 TaxID=2495592 RepID=UPI000F9D50D2